MNNREVRDLLAVHADQLLEPRAGPPVELTKHERVQGLLDLAEELYGILVPVEPNVNFRRRLHGDLILEAQQRQPQPEASLFRQHRKSILIGAAAVGSVASVAGVVIAYVLRHRDGHATHIVSG